jgi:hypothetical protein
LRICLKQDPHCVAAWSDLVALSDGALSAPELEALLAACRQPGLADGPRTQLTLACGRALESRGRLREGYAMIATANAWRARDSDWDGARHARRCAAIAHAFEPHSASAADRNLGSEIVFIIDDAGAGADLEAALGAHARIAAGGELTLLGELVAEESRRRGAAFPAWIAAATATDWQRLGGLYLQRSASLRTTKACSTDRSPALPLLLGAAAAMLPGARIIECRRDPLEACWTLHRDARAPGFASDLVDLADYRRERERLLDLWRARYGARMYAYDAEVRGEARTAALHALLAQAGIAPDPACDAALAARDAARAALDARETGLRHQPRARDHGALVRPLQRLIDGLAAAATRPVAGATTS